MSALSANGSGDSSATPWRPMIVPTTAAAQRDAASAALGRDLQNERRSRMDTNDDEREKQEGLEREGLEQTGVGGEAEAVPAEGQQAERLDQRHHADDDCNPHERADVPGLRLLGWLDAIRRQGDVCDVGEADEQQHHQRRDDELARHEERNHHEPRLENASTDLVHDPREHALIGGAPVLHQVDDVDQAAGRQHRASRALGHVGGAAHRDADLRLFERRCVVDAVAGHAHDVTGRLQALDDEELVLGEHLGKTSAGEIGRRARCILVCGVPLRGQFDLAEAEHTRDLARDRESVARQHQDLDAERSQLVDEAARVGTWCVVEQGQAEEAQRPVAVGARHRQRADALLGLLVRALLERGNRRASSRSLRPCATPLDHARLLAADFDDGLGVARLRENGSKETVFAEASSSLRSLAARRNATSIGSALAAFDASAPARTTSFSSTPVSGSAPVSESWFIVRVPVLSAQRTSMLAASSIALRCVMSTPRRPSSIEPTAMLTVNITGSATGTALMSSTSAMGNTSTTRCPWTSAVTNVTAESEPTIIEQPPHDPRRHG